MGDHCELIDSLLGLEHVLKGFWRVWKSQYSNYKENQDNKKQGDY